MFKSVQIVVGFLIVSFATVSAQALPVIIPNFAVDPSGAAFTISPVAKLAAGSTNLVAAPSLTFGVTSAPDGTTNTLQMNWDAAIAGEEAQAGWELVFGADPNLVNQTITLDVNAPGGWSGAVGGSSFGGILSVEVRALDNNGNLAGGWGFNTDQALLSPAVSDPTASGLASVLNNQMNTVTINIGTGPVAGSATVFNTSGLLTGPNYLIAGNNNFANILTLQFFENGILQGGLTVIPGQTTTSLLNYWTNITVSPEPSSLALLALAGGVLAGVRRRRG